MSDDNEKDIALAAAMQQVASSIAIAALERTLREGRDVTIPALGITIKGDPQPESGKRDGEGVAA